MRNVMHCVFAVPNPTRVKYSECETPKSLAMFIYFIREWLETYHCLFMHSSHYKMHFHARQHPIYIAENHSDTATDDGHRHYYTDIVDTGI